MRELLKVMGFMFALIVIGLVMLLCTEQAHGATKKNDFISGYDYTRTFLNPNRAKGKNFHKRMDKIEGAYEDPCEKFMPDAKPECYTRILIESGGHPWSRTKDSYSRECGLTSIGYPQAAAICEEYEVCGDPCGDVEFAIGAYAWMVYKERKALLETHPYWSEWMPRLCDESRTECEMFVTLNLDTNTAKAQRIINKAGTKHNKHVWWDTIKWFRGQSASSLKKLFGKIAVSFRRYGLRWGLAVQKVKIRKDRLGEYNWGPVLAEPPAKPIAKNPLPKQSQWRKRCHAWKSEAWWATKPKL
jgi:hypothetical protein